MAPTTDLHVLLVHILLWSKSTSYRHEVPILLMSYAANPGCKWYYQTFTGPKPFLVWSDVCWTLRTCSGLWLIVSGPFFVRKVPARNRVLDEQNKHGEETNGGKVAPVTSLVSVKTSQTTGSQNVCHVLLLHCTAVFELREMTMRLNNLKALILIIPSQLSA